MQLNVGVKMVHKCKVFCSAKMVDVVIRNRKFICCRRCGEILKDDDVEDSTLQICKEKIKNGNNK